VVLVLVFPDRKVAGPDYACWVYCTWMRGVGAEQVFENAMWYFVISIWLD